LDLKPTLISQQQRGLLLHHAGHEVQDIYAALGGNDVTTRPQPAPAELPPEEIAAAHRAFQQFGD
jgi:hypothetical protein